MVYCEVIIVYGLIIMLPRQHFRMFLILYGIHWPMIRVMVILSNTFTTTLLYRDVAGIQVSNPEPVGHEMREFSVLLGLPVNSLPQPHL